jgi:hypothetical protein
MSIFLCLSVPRLISHPSSSILQSRIVSELLLNQGVATSSRAIALQVARSLQQQLFFYEIGWGGRVLQDGVEDVYMFKGGYDLVPFVCRSNFVGWYRQSQLS